MKASQASLKVVSKSKAKPVLKFDKHSQIWLDVGCGEQKGEGSVGMDIRQLEGVDVIHDAEETPWPFEDNTFTRVTMSHIVEHIKPWRIMDIMDEIWRISKVSGILMMAMPYPNSVGHWQDPTHIRPWNEHTAKYFDPDHPDLYLIYKPRPWKIEGIAWQNVGNIEIALRKRPMSYIPPTDIQEAAKKIQAGDQVKAKVLEVK